MLRQTEWWVQNGPIEKNRVLPVTTLIFLKILFQFKSLIKSWFDAPNAPRATQLSIFVLFVSTGVLFDSDFSLLVFLSERVLLIKLCIE